MHYNINSLLRFFPISHLTRIKIISSTLFFKQFMSFMRKIIYNKLCISKLTKWLIDKMAQHPPSKYWWQYHFSPGFPHQILTCATSFNIFYSGDWKAQSWRLKWRRKGWRVSHGTSPTLGAPLRYYRRVDTIALKFNSSKQ